MHPVDDPTEVDFGDNDDFGDVYAADEETGESSSSAVLDAATRAAVGVGARVLFYPTLAYNVVRNHFSPSRFQWWNRIDGTHILLGAVPFESDVPRLYALRVRAVVTLTEPYERLVPAKVYAKPEHPMDNLVLPTRDYLYAPSPDDLRRAVEFIHRDAESGDLTYVHCKAGRARSATVVMCYLVRYKWMTPALATLLAKETPGHQRVKIQKERKRPSSDKNRSATAAATILFFY